MKYVQVMCLHCDEFMFSLFTLVLFLAAEDIGKGPKPPRQELKNERVADRIFHIESNKRVVSSFQAVKVRHQGGLHDLFTST